MTEEKRPKVNSAGQRELDKAQENFEVFDAQVKEMTLDRMNKAPIAESEQQVKLSKNDLEKSKEIYIKPKRSFPPGVNPKTGEREKFNEKFRADYEFQKEYVRFVAQNNEIIGETIEFCLKKFPGTNCDEWAIPVNKPVWAPRMVAERIKNCRHHRLVMQDNRSNGSDHNGQYYGTMSVDTTVQRLDAYPAVERKSVFMGAVNF
jgi:hypothetical protein